MGVGTEPVTAPCDIDFIGHTCSLMKFPLPESIVPQASRAEINAKVLGLIGSGNLQHITPAMIFQAYTGNGGLHGFKFSDYDNRHEFSKAKKEVEHGQFFTPAELTGEVVKCVPVTKDDLVADLTCGAGVFFNFLPNEANCFGCELDISAAQVAKFLYPEAKISQNDIRFYSPEEKFDLIFGNPPFNLDFSIGREVMLSQEYFMIKAHQTLSEGGLLTVIVPASFMADPFSDKSQIEAIEERFSFIAQCNLPKGAFAQMGVKSFATKLMFFQKRSEFITFNPYQADQFVPFNPEKINRELITPALEIKRQNRHKLMFTSGMENGINNYSIKNSAQRPNEGYEFMVKKLMFEIKRHPLSRVKYGQATTLLEKFRTQKRPDNVSAEEWQKMMLTMPKVISQLKKYLKGSLNPETRKEGYYVIRTMGGIRIEAVGPKQKKFLKDFKIKTEFANRELLSHKFSFKGHRFESQLNPYAKLYARKRKLIALQQKPFSLMRVTDEIKKRVAAFTFLKKDGLRYSFNAPQRADLGLTVQKPYGSILAWQQGGGKTPGGYFAILEKRNSVRNVFVVATPISINLTWVPFLELQKENFIQIQSFEDFAKIQPGQIVVMPITLTTIKKSGIPTMINVHLKKFLKRNSNKVMLLFDESDAITSYTSKRSWAMRVFKKVKYKLMTTGTTTRNNIAELYGQLELIFNNSYSFTSNSRTIFREVRTKEDGVIIREIPNYNQNEPFGGYSGNGLFKASFAPSKSTVFGIQKTNQDVYNREYLEEVISATIQTRKFREIVGDGKYQLHTHKVKMNVWENSFYETVLKEFHTLLPVMFKSTGSSRKDSMLRLVRQINTLIKACSVPHLMSGNTDQIPTKGKKILSVLKTSNTKTLIGCVTKKACAYYVSLISKSMPGRPVFVITGDLSNIKDRQKVIDKFEATENGILIATQQSLSESVNIPLCKEVIIESLRWNMPRLEQFYYRCIRFDSVGTTNVHFVIYERSIEVNLMALLADKERLNDFVKTLEVRQLNEVLNDFTLDMGFLNMIINREADKDGKMQLTWGQQKVA